MNGTFVRHSLYLGRSKKKLLSKKMNATNSSTVGSREEQLQYWSRRFGLSPHELDRIWRLYGVLYPMPRCDQQVPSDGAR